MSDLSNIAVVVLGSRARWRHSLNSAAAGKNAFDFAPAEREASRIVFPHQFSHINSPSLVVYYDTVTNLFDLYLYSEGTQASTLWRVSFPFVLLPLCFIILRPSTLTPTARATRAHSISFH